MKKLILIALVLFSTPALFAQNTDYEMWETMYMTPKLDQLTKLSANLAAHLKAYHQEAPNSASVWRVTTGPHTGKLVWIAGPKTFTDMDNELPAAHGEDWVNNVSPYLQSIEQGEFWRENKEHRYIPEGDVARNKLELTYLDIKNGKNEDFNVILNQIAATIKEIKGKDTWQVYNRTSWNNDGRDVAWTSLFDKWANFDNNDVFVETFKKLHGGDASWDKFLAQWNDCVESAYQEHFVFATNMNPSE